MSRTELMAAVALAAGLSLTVAEIATSDSDGGNLSAGALASGGSRLFDLASRLGLGGPGQPDDPLQLAEGDMAHAYW